MLLCTLAQLLPESLTVTHPHVAVCVDYGVN